MSGAASVAQGGDARPLRVGAALAGVVLAAVLLFSLGVMTGARVALRSQETPAAAPPAPMPAQPPPAIPVVPAESLTFYDRLSGAAPPLPQIQPDESAERSAGATAAAPAVPAAPLAAAVPTETQEVVKSESAAAAKSDSAKPGAGDTAARVKKLQGKGPYAVQVAAMTDRAAATAMAERLKGQGLPATTAAVTAKGKTLYRVRVGSYPSRDAADRAAGLLHTEMKLDATPVRN